MPPPTSPVPSPTDILARDATTIRRLARAVARRGGLSSSDADDFESLCWLHLVENDFRVLRQYRGTGVLPAYLRRVFYRVLLDYRTSCWGKWRPSAAARRAGTNHVAFERLAFRDGIPVDEALRHTGLSRTALGSRVKQAPRARRQVFVDLNEAVALSCPRSHADRFAAERERQARLTRVTAVLREALGELSPRAQELLRLRYDQGRSVADVAAVTGLPQKPLYRWFDRTHAALRIALESAGVTPLDVSDIEGGPFICLDRSAAEPVHQGQRQ